MKNTFAYEKEFALAKKLIKLAYKKILKNHTANNVDVKLDESLVTNLDLACEQFVLTHLKKHFPSDNYVSEETNSLAKLKNRSWILDPIDGTNYFIKGYTHWAIQLAFYDEKEVKFSIVYLPKTKEFFECKKGMGVFLNGQLLPKRTQTAPRLSLVEYSGSKKATGEIDSYFKIFAALSGAVLMQNSPWAACYLFTNLAFGRSDVLVNSSFKLWDYLPGELMALEQGAVKTVINKHIVVYSVCPEITEKIKKACSK